MPRCNNSLPDPDVGSIKRPCLLPFQNVILFADGAHSLPSGRCPLLLLGPDFHGLDRVA